MAKCKNCGSDNQGGAKFCTACGKKIDNAAVGGDVARSAWAAKNKAVLFEEKHKLIVNLLIAALGIVFLFVALFAPIKTVSSDVSSVSGKSGSEVNDSYKLVETYETDQTIWKIFGAIKYLSLDSKDARDMFVIEEIFADVERAEESTNAEYEKWLARHPYATKKQAHDKYGKLYNKYTSDINVLGYQFAFTTTGALDNISGTQIEKDMNDTLIAMRSTAVISLVTAFVSVALRLGVAILSIVFTVLALLGIVRRKTANIFAFLTAAIALSGAELAVLSVAPLLTAAGGAAFAVALTAAIAFVLTGGVKAATDGKGVGFVIKRVAHSALTVTALFLLCSYTVTLIQTSFFVDKYSFTEMSVPLGSALESIIAVSNIETSGGLKILYSSASTAVCVTAMIFGLIAFVSLLTAMLLSLRKLAYGNAGGRRADVMSLVGAIALILFAAVPAAIGAADELPIAKMERINMAMQIQLYARAYVYVSLALAVIAFLADVIFAPRKPAAACACDTEASDGANVGSQQAAAEQPVVNAEVSSQESASVAPEQKPKSRKKTATA